MGYKMKGAPMMGNTKSHGTNKNYKMSGMTNTDGTAGGPPFLGKAFRAIGGALTGKGKAGMIMNPLGHLARKAFGRKRNQNAPVDPNAVDPNAVAANTMTAEPTTPPVADPAAVEDPNAVDPTMSGAPMYGKKKGAPKLKGNQHKIDKNKDGKISKVDFDMM